MGKCFLIQKGVSVSNKIPENALASLADKGVTVTAENNNLNNLASLIDSIIIQNGVNVKTQQDLMKFDNGTCEINFSFKPDILLIFSKAYEYKNESNSPFPDGYSIGALPLSKIITSGNKEYNTSNSYVNVNERYESSNYNSVVYNAYIEDYINCTSIKNLKYTFKGASYCDIYDSSWEFMDSADNTDLGIPYDEEFYYLAIKYTD